MINVVLSALGLLLISCSHAATGSNQSPSSQGVCSSNADCTADGEFCDYLFPKATNNRGNCTHACNSQNCANGEICNFTSGFCETTCNGNSLLCTIQGQAGVCIGSGSTSYCAVQATGGSCSGSKLKASNGFCKVACSGSGIGDCSNTKYQICDAITSTCEIGCTTGSTTGSTTCGNLAYTSSSGGTTVNFSCSPVTATCMPSCVPGGASTCPDTNRNFCSAIGNTCEFSCATSNCPSNQLTCSSANKTQICVISCSVSGFKACPGDLYCQGNSDKTQTCQTVNGQK